MSTEALATAPAPRERDKLVRRARALAWLSIVWMAIEGVVGVAAALVAGSVALLGFGLDSLVELASAGTIIWRFSSDRAHSEQAERRAQQAIALCFVTLALYLTYDAIVTLVNEARPETSWPGVAVSAAAVVLMPLLARAKGNVATRLGSSATASDAAQSWLCAIIAAGTLVSLLANDVLGGWWLDPAFGLVIAAIAIREAKHAHAGEACADCAPITLDDRCSHDAART